MAKRKIILSFLAILIIAGVVAFLNTSVGKLLTIKQRGYTEISKNVYWDNECDLDQSEELLKIINQSHDRLEKFWGNIENNAIIVISNNPENLSKLGLNANSVLTSTFVLNGAKSYIAVNIDKADTDVLSHEMSHAELHARIFEGRYSTSQLVPMWFDEGLAMQVDYREKYNEDAWVDLSQTLNSQVNLSDIESSSQFFSEDSEIRTNNYIISRNKVNEWLAEHGHEGLLELIDGIREGIAFEDLY